MQHFFEETAVLATEVETRAAAVADVPHPHVAGLIDDVAD